MPIQHSTQHRLIYFILFIVYMTLVAYGSLVPLNFRELPMTEAVTAFKNIPYLSLSAGSRADWVANILLYIPLSFLFAGFSLPNQPKLYSIFIYLFILSFCFSLAVFLEFCQLFFPPRTVSQNDLLAEALGSISGVILWVFFGQRLNQLLIQIFNGGKQALTAMLVIYTLSYLILSFFPFDFVASYDEWHAKFETSSHSWFLSGNDESFMHSIFKILLEILLVIPIALPFCKLMSNNPHRQMLLTVMGFILGLSIEFIQLFIISGMSQGISIFTRMTGMWTGGKLYSLIENHLFWFQAGRMQRITTFLIIPYTVLVSYLNGWFQLELSQFYIEKFNAIQWLPFYYHYFTSEAVALVSLLYSILIYIPLCMTSWLLLRQFIFGLNDLFLLGITTGSLLMIFSLIMETGKFFLSLKHPDPTNVYICFFTGFMGFMFMEFCHRCFKENE